MTMKIFVFVLLAFASLAQARINLVLLGATGDLAQKYLYQALYEQVTMKKDRKLIVTPGATRDESKGQAIMDELLVGNITCRDLDEEIEIYGNCTEQENFWLDSVRPYRQLRTAAQYSDLGRALETDMVNDGVTETGRLIYLSVPPKFFGSIAKHINNHLRPLRKDAWLRVVFEKPFGKDLKSAKKLAADISAELQEEEILRVDHYMGKKGLEAITEFRGVDPFYESILNRKHVISVEVSIHERIDVAGRTGYFDENGIIRDMAQNHLTEMAVRAAMDSPIPTGNAEADRATFAKNRMEALEAMMPILTEQSLLGQYEDYQDHLLDDLNERSEEEVDEIDFSNTPTFFGTVTEFDTDRWEGVPFVFTTGKDLSERVARVRYNLRKGEQVAIYIQGRFTGPAVLTTYGSTKQRKKKEDEAPKLKLAEGWDYRLGMLNFHYFQIGVFNEAPEAYLTVVDRALEGDRTFFVDTESLLLAWEKWDKVITETEGRKPFIYGVTNSTGTVPSDHLTDAEGMVKQIYGKDYEPDTDYEHPKSKVVPPPAEATNKETESKEEKAPESDASESDDQEAAEASESDDQEAAEASESDDQEAAGDQVTDEQSAEDESLIPTTDDEAPEQESGTEGEYHPEL